MNFGLVSCAQTTTRGTCEQLNGNDIKGEHKI